LPDITMCQGTGCPLKERCHRYTAEPCERRQSYFSVPPVVDGKCDHFWDNAKERKREDVDNEIL